jgi:hypothetical protein
VEAIQALARSHCPDAIQALADALKDPDRAVPAAIAILDRGIGKPAISVLAQVQADLRQYGPDCPPRESLAQWIERRRRELSALDGPPTVEHVAPQPQTLEGGRGVHTPRAPNGEQAASAQSARPPGEGFTPRGAAPQPATAPVAERATSSSGEAAASSTRSQRTMTEDEARWLADQRRRLNIDPNRERDD